MTTIDSASSWSSSTESFTLKRNEIISDEETLIEKERERTKNYFHQTMFTLRLVSDGKDSFSSPISFLLLNLFTVEWIFLNRRIPFQKIRKLLRHEREKFEFSCRKTFFFLYFLFQIHLSSSSQKGKKKTFGHFLHQFSTDGARRSIFNWKKLWQRKMGRLNRIAIFTQP